MKLRPIGSNKTELETDSITVLFSYGTPVACHVKGTGECYRTQEKHKRGISLRQQQHISSWLAGVVATPLPQASFDRILQPNYLEMEALRYISLTGAPHYSEM